jgi:hypothetical protein
MIRLVGRWLGADHKPSTCCISMGQYEAELIAHDFAPDQHPHPGRWRCACPCRQCQRKICPTWRQQFLEPYRGR